MVTIVLDDISTGDIEGEGSFDVLMSAVELRLQAQYDSGRITGTDFATVYLGAMQAVLQQSIAYTLGVQKADKDADLVAAQILTEAKVTLTEAEKVTASTAATARNDSISVGQITKLTAEENLLDQKTETERAQTEDTITAGAVTGVIGDQKLLYTAQTAGFTRDAEVKAAKVFTDLWTIAKSTSPDDLELALPFNLDQASMDAVLLKIAENGIGMTETELGSQSSEASTNGISGTVDPGAAEVIVTTDSDHGLVTGDAVGITGVTTMTEVNDNSYIITKTADTTFTLDNTDGVTFTTPGTGGTVTKLN